ncbi:SDR family NAD(P)-dependent oxidoreductase [Streptomyces scopuliridis]|uniref:SDR family NAD(P)-dependent oxidoreductase n=1 Tax=Streptomyces scopuliridis TaxID=452529 RepID=UPI003421E450
MQQKTIDHENYQHYQAGLAEVSQIRKIFRSVRQEHGRLDALINNAGTSTMNHFMMTPDEVSRRLFDAGNRSPDDRVDWAQSYDSRSQYRCWIQLTWPGALSCREPVVHGL